MGRPIKKRFFGNLNTPYDDAQTGGPTGGGGEGVSSTIVVGSTGTNYSLGSVAVFSSPQLPGGTLATANLTVSAPGAGGITAVSLVTAGSGYTSTATISITTATAVSKVTTGTSGATTIYPATTSGIFVGMTVEGTGIGASSKVTSVGAGSVIVSVANASTVTGTVSFNDYGSGFSAVTALTNLNDNALAVYAFVPGGSSGVIGDIMKQESSRRYLVKTAQGQGQCRLVAVATGSLVAGEMNLVATDSNNSTYYVTKLTSRRATLTQRSMGSSYLFQTGDVAAWSLDPASGNIVSIANN